jgi:predicted Zn-ribbon and HTH transcriptional regulator
MTDEFPINDKIPRDPKRTDRKALRAPENLDADQSLHSTHAHTKSGGTETDGNDVDDSVKTNTPRCAMCGFDRTGLHPKDRCPACEANQNAPTCTFCGYELSGLLVTENCPECGKPIWDSNIQPPTSGLSIASMVIGIVGLATCIFYGLPALVLGPLAIIFGEIANRQFKNGTRAGNTKGYALTGRICGWAGFAIGATVVVLFLILIYGL